MKILFLTYDFPYPANSGGKNRVFNLMKCAKSANVDIFLYSFVRDSYDPLDNVGVEKIGVSHIYTHLRRKTKNMGTLGKTLIGGSSIFKNLYFDVHVQDEIYDIIFNEKIDTVIYESFYTSFYISDKLKEFGVKQIFGTENIEHILYYDLAKTKSKMLSPFFMSQVEKVRREEEKAYDASDLILAVCSEDQEYIQKKTKTEVIVIPNGVDAKALSYQFKKSKGKNLLFVGNFSYFPNIDAMNFFYHNVFLKMKDASMTVVGRHQKKVPFLLSDPRIKNIEYVENLKIEYNNADVFIFPVRFGGGTNFKILEAAACGVPVIAIPERVKGLGFIPDEHYVSADNPQEYIDGISKLFDSVHLRQKLSENARNIIEKNYDWAAIGEKMNLVLQAL